MFLFLKGLRWYEWVLLGVLISVSASAYLFYRGYQTEIKKNVDLTNTIQLQQKAEDFRIKSDNLNNNIIKTYVEEKSIFEKEQMQSRKEVIDEYIKNRGSDETPQVVTSKPERKEAVVEKTVSTTNNNSLSILANRMQQHYCKATRNSTGCNP